MNKKGIVIIGVAVLILIAVSVAVLVIHRDSVNQMELDTQAQGDKDRMGIDYGGGFNEAGNNSGNNFEKDEYVSDEPQSESDYENVENITADELKDELRRQRETNGFGRNKDDFALNVQNNENNENNADYDDFIDDDFEEAGESVDISELGIVTIESTGYALNEVLYNAESQEEAETVATQLSGTLVSWEHGVALIQIDGSVDKLLEDLEQQGSSLYLYRHYYY